MSPAPRMTSARELPSRPRYTGIMLHQTITTMIYPMNTNEHNAAVRRVNSPITSSTPKSNSMMPSTMASVNGSMIMTPLAVTICWNDSDTNLDTPSHTSTIPMLTLMMRGTYFCIMSNAIVSPSTHPLSLQFRINQEFQLFKGLYTLQLISIDEE